jgi:NAD(P)-dependent dehydrogenase (short-subunit alcohol dehydrogenase family)
MGKLSGKIALITDGNSGIGLESARVFIEEGARVFLTERNRETLDAGARSVGSQAITIQRTQKTSREIDKLFAAIAGQVDGLDILFVNAGVGRATPAGPDARSGLRRTLRRQREGRVLHRPGGAAATQARKHNHPQCFRWCLQWLAGYAASKAAVRSLARGFSADLVKRGIRVNVLSPGPTATPGLGEDRRARRHSRTDTAPAAEVYSSRAARNAPRKWQVRLSYSHPTIPASCWARRSSSMAARLNCGAPAYR